jgi:hypothetical protein
MRIISALLLAILVTSVATAQAPVGAFTPSTIPVSPAGVRAVVDLPASQHMRNTGGMGRRGPGTGAGLCVFTSIVHSARWQNILDLEGFRKWMESKPGGGYPAKVDAMLSQWCKEKGVPVPAYVQHTGGDDAFLELAIRTGRCPCVTYAGSDDFYGRQVAGPAAIDHMVNLIHLDESSACILDNNRPGVFLWMTRKEFETRWRDRGGGWAIVFLDAPPPPYNALLHPFEARAVSCGCDDGDLCGCDDCRCAKPAKVYGQMNCPNGRCPAPAGRPAYRIEPAGSPSEPIGSPPSDRHEWRAFDDGTYGWRFKDDAQATGLDIPTGVMRDRIHEHPAYSRNGQEVTKDEAHAALGASALTDDSDRWHLTAVGDSAFLSRIRADVAKLPAEVRTKLLLQSYLPSAWQVAQFKLPAAGVVLRKPSAGRVSADVGSIAAAEYSGTRLDDLLGEPAGPSPRPAKPKPAPDDTPSPEPTTFSIHWLWLVATGFVLYSRKK